MLSEDGYKCGKNVYEWLSVYGRANVAGNKLTYMKACSLHAEIVGKIYLIY